jgi:hypothetical protein
MSTLKKQTPLIRLMMAMALAAGISGGLTAYESAMACEITCGGGCQIQVENCPDCERDPENCTIYFENPSCEFYCSSECTICETFENSPPL